MESRLLRAGALPLHPGCDETGSPGRYPVGQFRTPATELLQHLLQCQDTYPFDAAHNGSAFVMPDDIADRVISTPLLRTNQ